MALKKQEGQGMSAEDKEADANIDVLSVMHKSNVRFKLSHQRSQRSGGVEEEEEEDEEDKHKVPQHRRYLTFGKVFTQGSHRAREKIDNSNRLERAVSNSHKYQLEALGLVDQAAGHNILTSYKTGSQVEDQIQLSILQGDFDDLRGEGKPKDTWVNPFSDRAEDLAYDILRKHGVKPEWVETNASMTLLNNHLRALVRARLFSLALKGDDHLPPSLNEIAPSLRAQESLCWEICDLYNLQVPSHTLTRGRISAAYEIEAAARQILTDPPLARSELLAGLSAAQEEVERAQAAVNRLASERGERGSLSSPSLSSSSSFSSSYYSAAGLGSSSWSPHGHHLSSDAAANNRVKAGVSAGSLTMAFFLAPVDRVIRLFERLM